LVRWRLGRRQSRGREDAIRWAAVENVGEKNAREGFRMEEEADVGFVFPGNDE
jgi:hypothetical protein